MRRFLIAVSWLGLSLLGAATCLGLLAPWYPPSETVNHFRPLLLVGAGALLAVALVLRPRRLLWGASTLFALTLALFLLPLLSAMPREEPRGRTLRVVSLNLWMNNQRRPEIVRHLERSGADVVLFQEFGSADEAGLEGLRATFPHALTCPGQGWRCDLALYSKEPWTEFGHSDRTQATPPMIWATFERHGLPHQIANIHLAYPFQFEQQTRQVDWLIDHVRSRSLPLVIAGDFNLTPFAWKLLKLTGSTGLRRAMTYGASWSTEHPLPLVLIDHVLASPGIGLVGASIGPNLGSDHLPVTADLALASPVRSANAR